VIEESFLINNVFILVQSLLYKAVKKNCWGVGELK
jgi:hypothetical protein